MGFSIVTGANRGIGLSIFSELDCNGYNPIAIVRNKKSYLELKSHFNNATIFTADMSDANSVLSICKEINQINDGLDLLVCNAGISQKGGIGIAPIDVCKWKEIMDVNVLAPQILTMSLIDSLKKSKSPTVSYISSVMGSFDSSRNTGTLPYAISKAALNRMALYLSDWLVQENIKVLMFDPGWVQTEMTSYRGNITSQEAAKQFIETLKNRHKFQTGSFLNFKGEKLEF